MKKLSLILLIASIYCIAQSASAGEADGHSAYRVTSYNLGAILDNKDNKDSLFSQSYQPLLITSTAADILNSDYNNKVSWVEIDSHTANSNGLAVSAQFSAGEHLAFQGAFGITRNLWTPDLADYESASSWEANLGVIYKLLDNLSIEMHFGYMDTGDLFMEKNTYSDVENIIMISNKLTLSF
jgi:opacity protein-like surface antigen